MSTLVRGSRVVREQIMTLMEAQLPDALTAFRTQWQMKVGELPPPVRYDRYEAETLDKLPVLALSVTRARNFARTDVRHAEEQYEVQYACKLFAWVKHQDREPTERIRDDYATVVASVLLATPSLGGGGAFRFQEGTLDLSFSDVARVRGDRFVAGCSASFDVLHDESVRRVPIATADALTVEARVLPEHPGL